MYAALIKLTSFKMDQEVKKGGKVKEEPMEEVEYSEIRDGAENTKIGKESDLKVKLEKAVDVKREPSDKNENMRIKKEPVLVAEAKDSDKCPQSEKDLLNLPKDLNENSKSGKDEAAAKEEEAFSTESKNSSNYISDDSFKRNMHHMFPKIHADIIDTFKRDFCGLCGAQFDSEKRAWTHYFSPEHNHALKKDKKFLYPPFWKMIKLALTELKPAGASKRNIHDFMVKGWPEVKSLKESEIYDQLGANLVEMVTYYQNVQIDDDGKYKLGRGRAGKVPAHNQFPTQYFKSDKRYFIPDGAKYDQAAPPPQKDSSHRGHNNKDEHFGYRKYVAKNRDGYEDERVRGSGERRERGDGERKRSGRSRNRSRSRSNTRRNKSGRRERSRCREIKRSGVKESSKSRRRSRSRERKDSRSSRGGRKSPEVRRSERVKAEPKPSPNKFSPPPPPVLYQQPSMQMPMFSMPGSLEGGGPPIIIIPSNMSSGGFPPELLGGNFGMQGMQMFSASNILPQFGSFPSNTPPGYSFPPQMFQMPLPGSAIPSPPLSASPPLQTRFQL